MIFLLKVEETLNLMRKKNGKLFKFWKTVKVKLTFVNSQFPRHCNHKIISYISHSSFFSFKSTSFSRKFNGVWWCSSLRCLLRFLMFPCTWKLPVKSYVNKSPWRSRKHFSRHWTRRCSSLCLDLSGYKLLFFEKWFAQFARKKRLWLLLYNESRGFFFEEAETSSYLIAFVRKNACKGGANVTCEKSHYIRAFLN